MSEAPETGKDPTEDFPNPADRCKICGDHHAPDDPQQPRHVREREIGEPGMGSIPIRCCEWCEHLMEAPIREDECMVCGADSTKFSLTIEGTVGVDDVDVYYSGSLCSDCATDRVFNLQEAAADDPPREWFGPALQDGGEEADE